MLDRLIAAVPDRFTENHLRTVQRAVKAWRTGIARKLLQDSAQTLAGHPAVAAAPVAAVPPAPPPPCERQPGPKPGFRDHGMQGAGESRTNKEQPSS